MTKKRRGTKEGRHCHECAFLVLALPSLRVSVPPWYIILIRLELRARAETTLHFAAGHFVSWQGGSERAYPMVCPERRNAAREQKGRSPAGRGGERPSAALFPRGP